MQYDGSMYLMPTLKKFGRVGSAAILVISVLVFGGGLWLLREAGPWNGSGLWSPIGTALSIACIILAPLVALQASMLAEGRPLTLREGQVHRD